jgi:hypothetical protein
MVISGEGGFVRSEQCRNTLRRPQALLALVVGIAACGQERPTQPATPLAYQGQDTAGVLGAVASVINETNTRAARARVAPSFPRNCQGQGLLCWNITIADWQVSTGDRLAGMLATLLGVTAAERSPGGASPACPWPARTPETGYRVTVLLRFVDPDLARVSLDRRCVYASRSSPRGFAAGETFEVRRLGGQWHARIIEARIT